MAGLAVVATRTGQCEEVLDNGLGGLLVQTGDPGRMADALISLLKSGARRAQLRDHLRSHVGRQYSPSAVIPKIIEVYDRILESDNAGDFIS